LHDIFGKPGKTDPCLRDACSQGRFSGEDMLGCAMLRHEPGMMARCSGQRFIPLQCGQSTVCAQAIHGRKELLLGGIRTSLGMNSETECKRKNGESRHPE
jgi:hypothetical protein